MILNGTSTAELQVAQAEVDRLLQAIASVEVQLQQCPKWPMPGSKKCRQPLRDQRDALQRQLSVAKTTVARLQRAWRRDAKRDDPPPPPPPIGSGSGGVAGIPPVALAAGGGLILLLLLGRKK